jgi:antitoxin ChpS
VADRTDWTPGIQLNVTVEGWSLTPASRLPRGLKKLAHLLSGIDQSETRCLNEESHDGLNDAPQGKESI